MPDAIQEECEAWFRYADYCVEMSNGGSREFTGDAASHELFRQWQMFRDRREAVSEPQHKMNRMHAGRFSTRGAK